MRNRFVALLRSVVELVRPTRRVQPEVPISPEQLREAFREMLADPESRKVIMKSLVQYFPVQVGDCSVRASDVGLGTGNDRIFGNSCSGGDFSFPAKLGIGTPTPAYTLDIVRAGPNLRLKNTGAAGYVVDSIKSGLEGGATERGFATRYYDNPSDYLSLVARSAHFVLGADGGAFVFGKSTGTERLGLDNSFAPWMTLKSGNVGMGTTAPVAKLHVSDDLAGTFFGDEYGNSPSAFDFQLRKARGTAAAPAAVAVGDYLGLLGFQGRGTTGVFTEGASIYSQVEAVGGSTYANLLFNTRDQTSGQPAERVRIANNGNVGIGTPAPGYTLDIVKAGPNLRLKNTGAAGYVVDSIKSGLEGGATERGFATRYYDNPSDYLSLVARSAHFVLGRTGGRLSSGNPQARSGSDWTPVSRRG